MDKDWKRLTDFLVNEGIDKIDHTTKSYLAHLIGLYRFLEDRGEDEAMCRAGMFHSIYGTELFQGFKLGLDRRGEVRKMIGERAERLAYLNCAMDRASFDQALKQEKEPYRFTDRITKEPVELSKKDFDDLCKIHLYDWLEQVPRSKWWDYRREGYRNIAIRLGGIALKSYDQVFAAETASVGA